MSALRAETVTTRRGGMSILHAVSVALPRSGSVAIIGPNGAGKSTLLKQLAGLEIPEAGRILLGDRDLSGVPVRERVARIGYLPQHFAPHWDLTIDDLLRIRLEGAGRAIGDTITATLARFDLSALQRRRWSTLSGGEQARAILAAVLATDPPILLADEPGASLDVRHRLALVERLAQRGREHLSVVVMHDIDLAFRFFDRVILMDAGRIIIEGEARDLFDDRRLDAAFGVRFERLFIGDSRLLYARNQADQLPMP
ncbi:ABC transporter ATP-binding protein [Reyranella sp. CPCC 100927]|uniref:ABC transporter ATP-binding protein n=1 Tax=Reyranella sp. CPCC 100927 TaxID=2599616 RepID=UPI0011B754E4|nr:ABC transporter ATP-binding protein [Reyranella sp. CPCC 100927]TWT10894.1 ABC transporter ATP-binding protein [Reyranella sp. CPCC 100927]